MCPDDPNNTPPPPSPTVTPVGTGSEVAVGEVVSGGKYVLLEVPDYDYGRTGNQTSYLRMGLSQSEDYDTAKPERGADLLDALTAVGPGDQWSDSGKRLFEDDRRYRGASPGEDGSAPGAKTTPAQRVERSGKIFTNAGWRDHTEGNRVTTTRGDKVEVIGGNYKLVVKGWSDDPGNSAGLDLSGGLMQDFNASPGTITDIRWVPDYDGTWKVFEKTTKGSVDSEYQGDVTERFVGPTVTTIVGDENGGISYSRTVLEDGFAVDQNVTQRNPKVLEKTWASMIESYTGSSKLPVPGIYEEVWATVITSKTHATATITETTDSPIMSETVTGGSITSTTDVTGPITETVKTKATIDGTTQAALINETVLCPGTVTSTMQVGAINERIATGAKVESMIASITQSTVVCPVMSEVAVGIKSEIHVGAKTEVFAGAKLEVSVAGSVAIKVEDQEYALNKIRAGISTVRANANYSTMSLHQKLSALLTEIGI